MELTQEQVKTGIKNQMQEFLSKLYINFDKKQDYVMEPGTVNLFVADSVSFEIALKELLKVSQPASSEITIIKVSSVDGNSIPEMGKILKVIDEVNGWQEKGDTISIPRFNAFKEPEYPKFPIENYTDGNKNITYKQKDIFNPFGKEDGVTYALFAKALSSQYQREKFSVLDALYKRDFEKAKELRKEMLTNFDATDAINEMAKIDFSDSYSTESLYKKIDFLADRLDNEIVEKTRIIKQLAWAKQDDWEQLSGYRRSLNKPTIDNINNLYQELCVNNPLVQSFLESKAGNSPIQKETLSDVVTIHNMREKTKKEVEMGLYSRDAFYTPKTRDEMFFSSKTIDQIRATRDKDIMLEMPMSSENEFMLTSLNKKVALLKNVSEFLERNNSEVLNKVKDSVNSAIVEFNQAIESISNSMKNSVVTMKDIVLPESLKTSSMITLGNSLEGEALKINNSTLKDNGMIELGNSL